MVTVVFFFQLQLLLVKLHMFKSAEIPPRTSPGVQLDITVRMECEKLPVHLK